MGVPIYPIRTGSIYTVSNGKPQLLIDAMHLQSLMNRGLVPMLFGDVVVSDAGFSIISGDDIMLDLGIRLRPTAALFLTDVKGILGSNGELIRTISNANIAVKEAGSIDVTGGLIRKMRAALELSRYTKTYICAIWDHDSIRSIINNEEPLGCTEFRT